MVPLAGKIVSTDNNCTLQRHSTCMMTTPVWCTRWLGIDPVHIPQVTRSKFESGPDYDALSKGVLSKYHPGPMLLSLSDQVRGGSCRLTKWQHWCHDVRKLAHGQITFRCKSRGASRSFESEPRNLFWRNRFKIAALFWKRSFLTNTQAGENGGRCCKTLGERSSIITFYNVKVQFENSQK